MGSFDIVFLMQTELEILREENLKLKAKLSMQESTISSHLLYIAKLEEEIRVQLLARFGRSSEQFVNPNQLSLFDEIESDAELIKEADTVCVEAHKKSRGKRNRFLVSFREMKLYTISP